MLADRNKTALTHQITQATISWLDNHGFKPVETEVEMPRVGSEEKGWIADIASVIVPTQTELVRMKMVPSPPRYNYLTKDNDGYMEKREKWQALYLTLARRMTCLVEIKASRGDFRGDRKWRMTPPTDLAFVAVPSGMIKPEEYPENWGVIELRGDCMVKVSSPVARVATQEQHLHVIYEIAVRRDHRTRYQENREWWKAYRANSAADVSIDRIDKIIDAVRDIAARSTRWNEPITSIEQAFRIHGIRNARERQLERLAELFGIAAKKEEKEACV